MHQVVAKRDFIFTDEAGDSDPKGTPFYIQGLLHITDQSLKKLNIHLGAFRYFASVKNELKSTKLNPLQREKLLDILKLAICSKCFIKATAIYIDKKNYSGPYLRLTYHHGIYWKNVEHPIKFRHLMLRKLLEFHFANNQPQTKNIELIIDRFHHTEEQEQRMRNYLRTE